MTDSDESFEYPELTLEDLVQPTSPGLRENEGSYDFPLMRDKHNNYECLETVISAIVNGCAFGKLCLQNSKEPRTWMYNMIALTDTFVVAINKNDIYKMVDN